MIHLIDKDALVAEIEKKIKQYEKAFDSPSFASYEASLIAKGKYRNLLDILSFLDSLEVKEVDLEEEIERVRKTHFINNDFEKATLEGRQITNIAKHFFELGLNASNQITCEDIKLIWTIGDEIPYMPEEDFFKELLKRFKAQKGE